MLSLDLALDARRCCTCANVSANDRLGDAGELATSVTSDNGLGWSDAMPSLGGESRVKLVGIGAVLAGKSGAAVADALIVVDVVSELGAAVRGGGAHGAAPIGAACFACVFLSRCCCVAARAIKSSALSSCFGAAFRSIPLF